MLDLGVSEIGACLFTLISSRHFNWEASYAQASWSPLLFLATLGLGNGSSDVSPWLFVQTRAEGWISVVVGSKHGRKDPLPSAPLELLCQQGSCESTRSQTHAIKLLRSASSRAFVVLQH